MVVTLVGTFIGRVFVKVGAVAIAALLSAGALQSVVGETEPPQIQLNVGSDG